MSNTPPLKVIAPAPGTTTSQACSESLEPQPPASLHRPKPPDPASTDTTPLLSVTRTSSSTTPSAPPPSSKTTPHTQIIILTLLLILLSNSGASLIESPCLRIFESILCYLHYESVDPSKILLSRAQVGPGALGGVKEEWCKVGAVQAGVAEIKGGQALLDGFPGLLLAIPMGVVADRWGRKPFILLGLCSFPLRELWIQFICWFWQSFDLRLTWVSALHGLLGGSSTVVTALLLTVISDVTSEHNRSIIFTRIYSAVMLANFAIPPLSAWLMTINPWIPMFLGVVSLSLTIPVMLLIPETLDYKTASKAKDKVADENNPLLSPDQPTYPETESFLIRCFRPVVDALKYFCQDWKTVGLMITCSVAMLMAAASPLLLLYSSTKYNITFSWATSLLSVKAGFTIAVFLVLQPWLSSQIMRTPGMSSTKMDLLLARASALVAGVGWVLVGLAPNMATFLLALLIATMGTGYPMFARSYLTSLVGPDRVAELYTIISIIDTIALMTGSPILAWLFGKGLGIGGTGLGLPFWGLGLTFGAAWVLVCCINHKDGGVSLESGGPVADDGRLHEG